MSSKRILIIIVRSNVKLPKKICKCKKNVYCQIVLLFLYTNMLETKSLLWLSYPMQVQKDFSLLVFFIRYFYCLLAFSLCISF